MFPSGFRTLAVNFVSDFQKKLTKYIYKERERVSEKSLSQCSSGNVRDLGGNHTGKGKTNNR